MSDRPVYTSGTGIPMFEPNPVASLISKFMSVPPGKLIHERDRLESKLYNKGPLGGLLPNERQRLAAVCGALTAARYWKLAKLAPGSEPIERNQS